MKTKTMLAGVGLILFSILLLSSCHTTKGFGKDIEKGGQAIQRAATKTSN